MPNIETVIRDWLKALGSLTAATISQQEAAARLSAYAPLMAKELPLGAFTAASLAAVGRQCKFFPSYAELCGYLAAWWAENRPESVSALPPPEEEGSHAFWQRRMDAMRREWDDPAGIRERVVACAGDARALALLRALVERHAPQHSWIVPPPRSIVAEPAQ